jgi:hypothetical protein
VRLDFDALAMKAAYDSFILDLVDARQRPFAIWLPVPPSLIGLSNVLRQAKLGRTVERWFSQNPLDPRAGSVKDYLLTRYTISPCRRYGLAFPTPKHVPLAEAHVVAEWLAEKRSLGTPALMSAGSASAGVRICIAARDRGLDISGTVFRFTGEPYTEGKALVVAEAGCRANSIYSATELNMIGMGCPTPEQPDEVHVAEDRLAVLQRRRSVGSNGGSVGALLFTTLHPGSPKLTLNVEMDDYAVLTRRDCGCAAEELWFRQHLHTIPRTRSSRAPKRPFSEASCTRSSSRLSPTASAGRRRTTSLSRKSRTDCRGSRSWSALASATSTRRASSPPCSTASAVGLPTSA